MLLLHFAAALRRNLGTLNPLYPPRLARKPRTFYDLPEAVDALSGDYFMTLKS